MYERALAGFEKALGPEHTDTLRLVDKLGYLYRKQHHVHISSLNKPKGRSLFCAFKIDTSFRFILPVCHLWMNWRRAKAELSGHLGHMLLLVENFYDAIVAFEQQISKNHDVVFHSCVVYDRCKHSVRLPSIRYACVSCDDIDLCSACQQGYDSEGHLAVNLPTCRNHAFLAAE